MGVLVAVAVIEVLHQLRRRVPDGEGDREVTRLPDERQGVFQGHVRAVALGGGGQIDRRLGERDAAFGHADLRDHLEAGVRQQERVRIRQAHVLGGRQAQPAGDEEGILAAFDHPGQVVDGRVRVRPADALDEGRDDVVVHLPVLVVDGHVLLDALRDRLVVDDDGGAVREGVHHDLQDVQQLAGVAAAVAHQGLGLHDLDVLVLQEDVLLQCPVQKYL